MNIIYDKCNNKSCFIVHGAGPTCWDYMYTCCIIPPLFVDTFACGINFTFACEKLIIAHCEHLYNVMGNWKCLLCMIQHPMEGDKCTFKIWNMGQRLCFGLDVLEHFILFSKCKYQYQITPCSHTHVQELFISLLAFNTYTLHNKAYGNRYTTCRHFWMQAEGQTSRRWCTWGGHWWQEFSITVRSGVRAGKCYVLEEEMDKSMRQWILDKRRQKAVLVSQRKALEGNSQTLF